MRSTSIKSIAFIAFLTGIIASTNSSAWWSFDSTDIEWSDRSGTFNSARNYQSPQQMRVVKGHDLENYYLYIELAGIKPEEINIQRQGPRLILQQMRGSKEETESDYYYRSYQSYSSVTKRLMLPPDADPEPSKMKRENKENVIRLTIPKRTIQFGHPPPI